MNANLLYIFGVVICCFATASAGIGVSILGRVSRNYTGAVDLYKLVTTSVLMNAILAQMKVQLLLTLRLMFISGDLPFNES